MKPNHLYINKSSHLLWYFSMKFVFGVSICRINSIKNLFIKIFILTFFLLFFSCNSSNKHEPKYRLTNIVFSEGKTNRRNINLQYNHAGLLEYVEILTENASLKRELFFHYNAEKRVESIKSITGPNYDLQTFTYDRKGRLIKTDNNTHTMPRHFFYNYRGLIAEQVVYFNKRPFQYYKYNYDLSGKPIKCDVLDNNKILTQQILFTYDGRSNPLIGFSSEINHSELFYGYPIGNYKENLKRVIVTNFTSEKEIMDTIQYNYEYNMLNYPCSINDNTFFEYCCNSF